MATEADKVTATMFSRVKWSWLSFLVMGFDLSAVAVAWVGCYLVRFNGSVPPAFLDSGMAALMWVLPLYGISFILGGLYRGLWIFASLIDLLRIAKAVGISALLVVGITSMMPLEPTVPRSVLGLMPLLLMLIMGGARASYRSFKEINRHGALVALGKPVLLLGAGRDGAHLARELLRSQAWRLVGMLDDDAAKRGREIHGVKVLGPTGEVAQWAAQFKAEHVIIAMPAAPAEDHRRLASLCLRAGIKAMVLPALTSLDGDKPFLARIRNIDLDDLLSREPIRIDTDHLTPLLKGRAVMVTGAGGSIGSELCRQIACFMPAQLIAFEASEFALYRLAEEFAANFPDIALIPIAGDVKDYLTVNHVMTRYSPSIVFHAAAYKHVPLMEDINAWQAVRNNVLGTFQVAMAAARNQVSRFVLISTDKAVNPANVMGASKRLAEMVCQSMQQLGTTGTRFQTVRFGNVLGSDGSVVQKFQEQIARGGPVTVTHPEITRYFMTIPKTSQLVLQASCMGNGGEIFILEMGSPVKIVDLAHDLIRLYGFSDKQIRIVYSGLRPGEKLHEELLADTEATLPTHHPKLRIASARAVPGDWLDVLHPWMAQRRIPSDDEVRRDLRRLVPEYAPNIRPALETVAVPVAVAVRP